MISRRLALSLAMSMPAALSAAADDFPRREIRLIVPLAPGGGTDVVTRHLAEGLHGVLGRPVVVENVSGAGTRIGMAAGARAQPNGHTLVVNADTAAIFELIYANPTVDMFRDLTPIAFYAVAPIVLVANPVLPANDIPGLVTLARRTPGAVAITSSGLGTPHDLANRLLISQAGIDLNVITYRGNGPALSDLVSGTVQIGMYTLSNVLPHLQDRRLKALGVLGARRSDFAPDIPCSAELGMPALDVSSRYVAWVPAATPPDIVARLNALFDETLRRPAVAQAFLRAGFEPMTSSPAEASTMLAAERDRWRPILRAAGIQPA